MPPCLSANRSKVTGLGPSELSHSTLSLRALCLMIRMMSQQMSQIIHSVAYMAMDIRCLKGKPCCFSLPCAMGTIMEKFATGLLKPAEKRSKNK